MRIVCTVTAPSRTAEGSGCSGRGGRMARASFHQGVIVDKRRDENTDCFIVVWCDTSRHIPSKRGVVGLDDWSSPRGLQNHRREPVMHPSPRLLHALSSLTACLWVVVAMGHFLSHQIRFGSFRAAPSAPRLRDPARHLWVVLVLAAV